LKHICSSHFRKALDSAFRKRFLRENSYFLLSEVEKISRKQSKTNQILQNRARILAHRKKTVRNPQGIFE
jgi:hypothetical protein